MTGHDKRPDPAVWGGAAWLVTLLLGAAGIGQLTLVDALLLFGIIVVVPMAVPLHPAASPSHAIMALLAGAPSVPALLLARGVGAGLLVLLWLGATVAGTAIAARWWRSGSRHVRDVVWVAAAAYLVVGAAWLVADRFDLEPVGFAAPLVELTAVHFHYAGFASSLLAGCVLRRRSGRLPNIAAALIVTAPPVVALGFAVYAPLQIAGAVLLTAGLWLLAWEMIRTIGPAVGGIPGTLLVLSGLATLLPMGLAVQWAIGANYGTPALSIPEMTRLHGITNALGFTFLGLLAWRLSPRAAAPTGITR